MKGRGKGREENLLTAGKKIMQVPLIGNIVCCTLGAKSAIYVDKPVIIKNDDQMTFHLLCECGRFGVALWPF